MEKTKKIVRVALCTAMLIGGQLVLSGISGVEIVSAMLLCFSFCYGKREGVAIATVFSLLRCFIFGFHINVVVLYLIYYNLFALFFGWLGDRFSGRITFKKTAVVVASAVIFTALFTLLDDIITPLLFGFNANATRVYFLASLYTLFTQVVCNALTVSVLFVPLSEVILKIERKRRGAHEERT